VVGGPPLVLVPIQVNGGASDTLFVSVVLILCFGWQAVRDIPLVHCNEYKESLGLRCYPWCQFLLLQLLCVTTHQAALSISELLASHFWKSLLYPLSRVPTTGVFVRFVAVENTNSAAVRTSEVRMTSIYFWGGSTEEGAGVPCRRADSDWMCVWLKGIQQLAVSFLYIGHHRRSGRKQITGTEGTEVVWRSYCSPSKRIVSADTSFIFLCPPVITWLVWKPAWPVLQNHAKSMGRWGEIPANCVTWCECRQSRNRRNYFRTMVVGILDSLFLLMIVFYKNKIPCWQLIDSLPFFHELGRHIQDSRCRHTVVHFSPNSVGFDHDTFRHCVWGHSISCSIQ